MKVYTLSEIEKAVKDQGYRHLALYGSSGDKVMGFNNQNTKPSDRITAIKKRLQAPALPDGIYVIQCKSSLSRGVSSDDYPIAKGRYDKNTEVNINAPVAEHNSNGSGDKVLSYKEVLKLQTEMAEMRAEMTRLKEENEMLADHNEELAEGTDQEEEDNGDMGNNMSDMIGALAEAVVPVLDRHYDMQEKKLQLGQAQFFAQMNPQAAQEHYGGQLNNGKTVDPNQHAQPSNEEVFEEVEDEGIEMSEEEQEAYWKDLALVAETDPERYQQIMKELQKPQAS